MPTSAERTAMAQEEREQLIISNRAKFTKNRVVYVTPNGIHTAHDIENIDELVESLKEDQFEVRGTTHRDQFTTEDWFKHGNGDWWESYVITVS